MVLEELVKSLVGMTEAAAQEAVNAFEVQITRRDEESFMTDMMMNMNRVKLEIEKDIVVKATVG